MSRKKRRTALNQRTPLSAARARALAPGVARITNAALAAAAGTDFNDEPARFTPVLALLKPPSRR